MAKLKQLELKRKIQTQNIIIIALAIVIFVLMIVSGTAAWYIRTRSDSADIILSNPVNIYITEFNDLKDSLGNVIVDKDNQPIKEHEVKTDILEDYNTRVYPGDKIKMRLGIQLGSQEVEASSAYVRVKLQISYEKISDGLSQGLEIMASQNLLEYKDTPNEENWEKVDFNKYKIAKGDTITPHFTLHTSHFSVSVSVSVSTTLQSLQLISTNSQNLQLILSQFKLILPILRFQ